ncbi:MAG: microcin ABC transporter permease, partial [Rhodobacteraceae bacterium]
MLNYISRRIVLIVPTLLGIMLINFFLVQFVPGGPVEQIISDLESRTSFIDNIGSGSSELLMNNGSSKYKG